MNYIELRFLRILEVVNHKVSLIPGLSFSDVINKCDVATSSVGLQTLPEEFR